MRDLMISNVRPWGGDPVDVRVSDGVIASIEPQGSGSSDSVEGRLEHVDGAGRLLLPSFSDVHVHLDSTRVGLPFEPNEVERRSLWSFIQNDRDNWRDAEASV
ncbi:MAG TPA: N-isopropylammelide isopropylaminohydrolase, partial [Brevibacterium senegalense]|nr:N-isopropylammelide isopropylaminohydrolase [Brevibacterium senegalense]